jgi:hypothetical protein
MDYANVTILSTLSAREAKQFKEVVKPYNSQLNGCRFESLHQIPDDLSN